MDFAAAKKALLSWYDGYRFSPKSEARVCNPVSIGNALETGELKNYWEATGHATMIVNRIKAAQEALAQARTKDYAGPWLDGAPPVFCVGVNYDPAKRGIDDPLVEPA